MSSDYYLLGFKGRQIYVEVIGEIKQKQTERVLSNHQLLTSLSIEAEKITREKYNLGCSMAALPEAGKGIELRLIE